MRRVHCLVLLLVLVAGSALAYTVRVHLPDQHDPWAPLSIDHPNGLVTEWKLRGLAERPDECFAVLEASDLDYERLDDHETGPGCGFFDAGRLLRSNVSWGGQVTLTCSALVALARWERHALQPLARELFDQDLVRIRHYGTYSCRNINGKRTGRRSEHATANAIDVAAFVLEDGREIRVAEHWGQAGPPGRYLEGARDRACDLFRTVLGPEYNAAHHDHFHIDMGSYSICR